MPEIISLDLHTHLLEKKIKPEKWWNAVKSKQLNVVAITEHCFFKPQLAFAKLKAIAPSNILLLPGIELDTNIGHAVCFGLDDSIYSVKKFFERKLDVFEAIDLANSNDFSLSVSHPWGISFDSAGYFLEEKNLIKLVENENIGVEVYNGLVAQAGSFVYYSNWIKKPLNFFEAVEKNRVAKTLRLSKVGAKAGESLEKKARDVLERNVKAFELGSKAKFITAGSDAHFPERIGSGILKLKFSGKDLTAENALKTLRNKNNVVWSGPFVREISPGKFDVEIQNVKKLELLSGIRYAAAKTVKKGVNEKIVKKIERFGKRLKVREKILNFGKKLRFRKKIKKR